MSRNIIILFLLLILLQPSGYSQEMTRILFVGNSYSGQIRKTLTNLIKASAEGKTTELEFITPGGKTLGFHLDTQATLEKIKTGNWDFVVLQDQSQTPAVFPEKFESAAIDLDKLIDASGAKTIFYQTWGRKDGDKMNPQTMPTYKAMQKKLSDSYASAAKRCDAILAPVGDTWAKVRKADPKLGDSLYKADGSHPSAQGAYLAACVFYVTFFEKSPATIDYKGGLSDVEATAIINAITLPEGKPKSSAFPADRTLTNANGNEIEVRIMGRSKTQIFFTMNGTNHIYDIDQLSKADQTFIRALPINR